AFPNAGPNLRLTERFKRVDAETLLYEFTVSDPTTWTKPWTAQVPMRKSDQPMYEYACHEGNYGMPNLLSAARAVAKGKGEGGRKRERFSEAAAPGVGRAHAPDTPLGLQQLRQVGERLHLDVRPKRQPLRLLLVPVDPRRSKAEAGCAGDIPR